MSSKKDLFVFIHGFNVSFEAAAQRTAQLAFDLQFEGAPLFYSWPSETVFRYPVAEKNAEWTFQKFTAFLKDLATKSGAEQIHLIAHSMGNRVLTKALAELAKSPLPSLEPSQAAPSEQSFQSIVLAAPDVDRDDFLALENEILPLAKSTTLYVSNRDKALNISAALHAEPRLGQGGSNLVVLPGMSTIDATPVDTSFLGHSYYGDNANVVTDLKGLLRSIPPKDRPGLKEEAFSRRPFWRLVP